jgi:hypothetical protein
MKYVKQERRTNALKTRGLLTYDVCQQHGHVSSQAYAVLVRCKSIEIATRNNARRFR